VVGTAFCKAAPLAFRFRDRAWSESPGLPPPRSEAQHAIDSMAERGPRALLRDLRFLVICGHAPTGLLHFSVYSRSFSASKVRSVQAGARPRNRIFAALPANHGPLQIVDVEVGPFRKREAGGGQAPPFGKCRLRRLPYSDWGICFSGCGDTPIQAGPRNSRNRYRICGDDFPVHNILLIFFQVDNHFQLRSGLAPPW